MTRSLLLRKLTMFSVSMLGKSMFSATTPKFHVMNSRHKLAILLCPEAIANWNHETTCAKINSGMKM